VPKTVFSRLFSSVDSTRLYIIKHLHEPLCNYSSRQVPCNRHKSPSSSKTRTAIGLQIFATLRLW